MLREEAQKKLERDIIKLRRHREAIEKEIGQPIVTGVGIELNQRETFASPVRKAGVRKLENSLDTFSGVKTRYLTKFEDLNPSVPGPFVDNRE